jgi:hypothetical protein
MSLVDEKRGKLVRDEGDACQVKTETERKHERTRWVDRWYGSLIT